MAKKLTKEKAKTILKEGSVRGKKLTKAQKGLFGLVASRRKPTRIRKRQKK